MEEKDIPRSNKKRRADGVARGAYYPNIKPAGQLRNFMSQKYPKGSPASQALWGATYKEADQQQKLTRLALRYKGDGDYKKFLRGASRAVGGAAGAVLGGIGKSELGLGGMAMGALAGGRSGYDQGANFSKYMGWGDYSGGSVSGNQLIDGTGSQQRIEVNPMNNTGDIFISHSEFVQNVTCSSAGATPSLFQVTDYPVNPGLSQTFPFLSQLAQCFVLYELQGLMFHYKPNSGESGSASNSLGKVILATNYDPDALPYVNSIQMENYDYANSSKPSLGMVHGVETAVHQGVTNMLYVRNGSVTKSKVFTDIGVFSVATEGIPFAGAGTAILGELWVTYKIRLSRANLYGSLLGLNIKQDVFSGTASAAALILTQTIKTSNQIGCVIANVSATAMSITFPQNIALGAYSVSVQYEDSVTPLGAKAFATPTLLTNLTMFVPARQLALSTGNSGFSAPRTPLGAASNLAIAGTWFVTVNAPGTSQASFQVNVAAALTAATTFTIFISQVNANVGLTLA